MCCARHVRRGVRRGVVYLSVLLLGCGRNEDLTRAISAGVGRELAEPREPAAFQWVDLAAAAPGNDTLLHRPSSICWAGDALIVADVSLSSLFVFQEGTRLARKLGGVGAGPGRFIRVESIACAGRSKRFLVADSETRRISFFGVDGHYEGSAPAPPTPQDLPLLGTFAFAADGTWFDSWLGSTVNFGPYLSDREWGSIRLIRHWSKSGDLLNQFGEPVPYTNTVARRVFNRVFLDTQRDTVWAMTQADGVVRRFDREGRRAGPDVVLPMYYRGAEPRIKVKEPFAPGSHFRSSKLVYQPNVRGLAVVQDSLLAFARYRNWRFVYRGFFDYWPESSLEVASRSGEVLLSLAVPGEVKAVASDGGHRVALLVEERDRKFRVLVGRVPPMPSPGGTLATGRTPASRTR